MDAVLKIGGSLAGETASLKALCDELGSLAKARRIVVLPGGGEFADIVREFDQEFSLPDRIAHMMAILAMDQYGLFLSSITPNSHASYALGRVEEFSRSGALPILLPSRLMFRRDPLEHSWDVTSDSIAAYIAGLLHAKRLLLVTNVDGIFTDDPQKNLNARLIKELSANELLSWNRRTCVDRFLPKILLKNRLSCYVVNGKYPQRIKAILDRKEAVCTRILS